ncbi:MAG TPA: glycosyltransferase family 4 protein [Longimicrobiales bacterium]|nr:glycosyltransferase family 4 protein [Longimicrobiales bacterium]
MRILFFSDHLLPEPSAPAAHVYDRARIWAEAGHDVTIIASAPNFPVGRVYDGYRNEWRRIERRDGIRIVRVKTYIAPNEGIVRRSLDYASYMVSALFFALFERRPDIAISTSPHLLAAAAGAAFGMLRGVPHVAEIRDLWPASIASTTSLGRGRLYRLLERLELWVYRSSRRIIAFTSSYRDDMIARGVDGSKIDVVLNGADLRLFHPQAPNEELRARLGLGDAFVVGYLGTLGLAHGLDNVLDAAERVPANRVRFLLVGAGAARSHLMAEAERRGLENVVFVDRQEKEAMPAYWSVCDASLVHLKDDPLFASVIPSKIFESMAVGLPVLYVGPAGEGSAIVHAEGAGIVVPPADPNALANAVLRLAAEPARRASLAAASLAAAPRYSRERQARASLATLTRAAGGAA